MIPKKSNILFVDDDPILREVIRRQLEGFGFTAIACADAAAAKKEIISQRPDFFDAVLTDYMMPECNGLEFSEWLLSLDASIRIIILTALGSKQVVQRAMQVGLYSYLEKPTSSTDILQILCLAVTETRRRRAILSMEESAGRILRKHQQVLTRSNLKTTPGLVSTTRSYEKVGGDYLQVVHTEEGQVSLIGADVAGHDLYSTYISAYFLGTLHTKISSGQPLLNLFSSLNSFILSSLNSTNNEEDPSELPIVSSISLALVNYCPEKHTLTTLNHGLPGPLLVRDHEVTPLGQGYSPLGWAAQIGEPTTLSEIASGSLYLWTDGIECWAQALRVNSYTLMYLLLTKKKQPEEFLEPPQDDLSVLCYDLTGTPSQPTLLFYQVLEAQTLSNIDSLEEEWCRSLLMSLDSVSDTCISSILLIMRELVLNGLQYGIKNPASDQISLSLFRVPEEPTLYIRFIDPGLGHAFNLELTNEEFLEQVKRSTSGLYIVKSLAHKIQQQRGGADLLIEFKLDSQAC
jgi:CheY-like chemotaxis protein/anti-sigma regulatory factor (Ser/Thr protein kinase)